MVRHFRTLIVWQLAYELRHQVLKMTAKCRKTADRDFLWDIRCSARSVASNTAEGHGRFQPGDIHRFLEIAKASLRETENHLTEGLASGDFSKADYEIAQSLVRRISTAMGRLMAYLRTPEAQHNADRHAHRTRRRRGTSKNQNPKNQ